LLNLASASVAVFCCERLMIALYTTSYNRSEQLCSSNVSRMITNVKENKTCVSNTLTNAIPSVPFKPWKRYTTKTSAHHLWSRRYLALLDLATSLLLQNRLTPRHTRCRLHKKSVPSISISQIPDLHQNQHHRPRNRHAQPPEIRLAILQRGELFEVHPKVSDEEGHG
jgi:hypothetical protein